MDTTEQDRADVRRFGKPGEVTTRLLNDLERAEIALENWKKEIAHCTKCHYHRHLARGLPAIYDDRGLCDECTGCQAWERQFPC